VLIDLATLVLAVARPHPTRVAVDGFSAAGKSTLAGELAGAITGRPVIRAEIDHFMRPPDARTAHPLDSPDSYYLDSWDYPAVRDRLLLPLGPGGDRRYRTATTDARGRPVECAVRTATHDAVLIADGVFLQRPDLDPHWDLRIWVDIGFDEVLRRGVARDRAWMGDAVAQRYRTKYVPGERRYRDEVDPAARADAVIDNRDPAAPRLTIRRRPA
jgi:uridine kinase